MIYEYKGERLESMSREALIEAVKELVEDIILLRSPEQTKYKVIGMVEEFCNG